MMLVEIKKIYQNSGNHVSFSSELVISHKNILVSIQNIPTSIPLEANGYKFLRYQLFLYFLLFLFFDLSEITIDDIIDIIILIAR